MSRRCRSCGRSTTRRHRTVFSQGSFWLWVAAVVAVAWAYAQLKGQA